MKQLILELKTGQIRLDDLPAPRVRPGQVLIRSRRSLVSAGTERMLVAFGRASLLAKARQQPERVRQMLDKLKTDGLWPTIAAVRRRLDQPVPLGYCNVGEVLALGERVTDLHLGQRVVSNGPHAEVVCVPRKLVAPVPDEVSDDDAAFTVVGAIALQSIRLLNPTLGETVVVIGLGLIGQLTADLLRINGCRVVATDPDESRCDLARRRDLLALNPNQTDVLQAVASLTGQAGADGVIIAATASGDTLLTQAARMSRVRGRIVLVGQVGLHLNRADFYAKELTFQVSCSYGPGRYDDTYEEQGHDYPLPFVRWTENRNFQTILQLLASGQLAVSALRTEPVPLTDFRSVYTSTGPVAALFSYPDQVSLSPVVCISPGRFSDSAGGVGLIGAGNYAKTTLLPALKQAGLIPAIIASERGLSAARLATVYGIEKATSSYRHLLDDPTIDLCLIATRHDSHARLAVDALRAGKHVFVEKPLALSESELADVVEVQRQSGRTVTVGFNRRYSTYVQRMKTLLGGAVSDAVPMHVAMTMNVGEVPVQSWLHDRAVGGGRLLGEGCHGVDLITFLTGSRVVRVCLLAMGTQPSETTDSASLLIQYANGATGVLNFLAVGSRAYAKERVEVHSQSRTLVLDNYRSLTGYGFRHFSRLAGRQDKGHRALMMALAQHRRQGSEPPIPFAESVNTTQAMLAALESLRQTGWVTIRPAIEPPSASSAW